MSALSHSSIFGPIRTRIWLGKNACANDNLHLGTTSNSSKIACALTRNYTIYNEGDFWDIFESAKSNTFNAKRDGCDCRKLWLKGLIILHCTTAAKLSHPKSLPFSKPECTTPRISKKSHVIFLSVFTRMLQFKSPETYLGYSTTLSMFDFTYHNLIMRDNVFRIGRVFRWLLEVRGPENSDIGQRKMLEFPAVQHFFT